MKQEETAPESQSLLNNKNNGYGSSGKVGQYIVADVNKAKKLGLFGLVALIFYEVSGGPFGIEDIVKAGGPFYAITGFSLLLVWAIPEALITAELSTAMPEASGSVGRNHQIY